MRYLTFVTLLTTLPAYAQEGPSVKVDSKLTNAWKQLGSSDETQATKAALTIATHPDAIGFLKANLKPVKADLKLVNQLIEQLGHTDFKTREAAKDNLEYLGQFAKVGIEKALKETSNEEIKQRLTSLHDRITAYEKQLQAPEKKALPLAPPGRGNSVGISTVNGETRITINGQLVDLTPKFIEKLPPPAVWVRVSRAIAVLEHLGTTEALAILESMSLGEDDAPPTKQAQEALARIKRSKQ